MSQTALWRRVVQRVYQWYAPKNDVEDWQKLTGLLSGICLLVFGPWWLGHYLFATAKNFSTATPDLMFSWHIILVFAGASLFSLSTDKELTFASKFCGLGFGLMSFSAALVIFLL